MNFGYPLAYNIRVLSAEPLQYQGLSNSNLPKASFGTCHKKMIFNNMALLLKNEIPIQELPTIVEDHYSIKGPVIEV